MDFKLLQDTICAIATPIGEAGIGIIRISGPDALRLAHTVFEPRNAGRGIKSHVLHYGWIKDPSSGEIVDEVLLSFMQAPQTYTREDIVEINCHSGYAVLDKILRLVIRSGARLAEPGEFTRRAFLSGRIDLSQAEAVAEVIRSRSEQGLLLAERNLRGDFRSIIEGWRDAILHTQSYLEAFIDFSEDLPEDVEEEEAPAFRSLAGEITKNVIEPLGAVLRKYEEGRVLREGLTLVLVGKPNVGKSSMLNALLGKDRAIVTAAPGTTRDVIEDSFLLSGVQVRILDTAGIHGQPDEIESCGIERALRSVSEADVVIWLIDHSRPLSDEDTKVYEAVKKSRYIVLLNKSDLSPAFAMEKIHERFTRDRSLSSRDSAAPVLRISIKNPGDIARLKTYLAETFITKPIQNCRSEIIPNLRQKKCLQNAREALTKAAMLLASCSHGELVSLELQTARKELEAILGWENDAELLDRIFSQFCIGK